MAEEKFLKLSQLSQGEEVGFENAREHFDKASLKSLAASIQAAGLKYPLQIWETTHEGKVLHVVVDGSRRTKAIEMILDEKPSHPLSKGVPVRMIQAKNLIQARYAAAACNMQRENLTSYEMAQEMYRLKELGETQKSIAANLNRSEAWVSRKISAYEGAGAALKKAWRQTLLPDEAVEEFATLGENEQIVAVEEALTSRGSEGRSQARKKQKRRAKKLKRASGAEIQALILTAERAAKDQRYIRGMLDMALFAIGLIDEDGFEMEWRRFKREVEKKAEREAVESKKRHHEQRAAA